MRRLLVLCWLVPSLAFAQTLAEGEALYGDGELAAALKTADAALKRTSDSSESSKLHVLRGLVLLAQGKKDKARGAFIQALQADAAAQLDPQRVPPAAVTLFDQAREDVPPGTVSVSTASPDAALRVDGTDFGPLPLTTKLAVGRHVLEATAGDGQVLRAEVMVKSGETQSVVMTAPVVPQAAPVEPPPLVASAPTVSATSASLLDKPAGQVKRTWWGLIPIGVALAGGWVVPPLLISRDYYAAVGSISGVVTIGALALGVGLIVSSGLEVEAAEGRRPKMSWWGLLPLSVGLIGVVVGTASHPAFAGSSAESVLTSVTAYAFALVGLGIGTGMLVGQAMGVAAASPKVSFFVLPQGGGGMTVAGRF